MKHDNLKNLMSNEDFVSFLQCQIKMNKLYLYKYQISKITISSI